MSWHDPVPVPFEEESGTGSQPLQYPVALGHVDVFWVMTALFGSLALAAILMKKPENTQAGGGH